MELYTALLTATAASLRNGDLGLLTYIEDVCARLDDLDSHIHAFLPEEGRRERLLREATSLLSLYPEPRERPTLFGIPVGIKDLFHVEGFPTRAGSKLPPEALAGAEASIVTALRRAGALILGKTTTEEFAYRGEPPPTRNPHNLAHTPGGSSSGSAAAVAAGLCPLALGTQTLRSTVGPAAYCGAVGFKLSHGRVPLDGLVLMSESIDSLGLFTQDVESMELAAASVISGWQRAEPDALPVLAIPKGRFMQNLSPEAREDFARQCGWLREAGFSTVNVEVPWDTHPEDIFQRMIDLLRAEMARHHRGRHEKYAALYGPDTTKAIDIGGAISDGRVAELRADQQELRAKLREKMSEAGVDLWITPSSWGAAPEGFAVTGSSGMTGPWSYAGLPAISLPAGTATNGLPLGLQCVAGWGDDERLIAWACEIEAVIERGANGRV
jgi:Asp-tRNA(Asn)/Glu-tRNA(Gln) amidotransferase A subunit family amidase